MTDLSPFEASVGSAAASVYLDALYSISQYLADLHFDDAVSVIVQCASKLTMVYDVLVTYAFSHMLSDAFEKEVRTQMDEVGDIVRWEPWMMEALVSICALSNPTKGWVDLLALLLTQNVTTTTMVLVALSLNREHSGYGVFCGIGPCLRDDTSTWTSLSLFLVTQLPD